VKCWFVIGLLKIGAFGDGDFKDQQMMNDEFSTPVTDLKARPLPPINRFWLIREIVSTVVFFIAIFTLLQLTLPRSVVHGSSMQPNFYEGQYLVISRLNYMMDDPKRGDILVFNSPEGEDALIKRVLGVPYDVVEIRGTDFYINDVKIDEPYINEPCQVYSCRDGARWELGEGEYFLAGDNRNRSNDSRKFGPVPYDHIIGKVLFRYWPLEDFGMIQHYRYK
jgi:signal peptidase I